jgi:multidrug resistance protein, MATE family
MISVWRTLRSRNASGFISRSWEVAWPMTLIMFFESVIGMTDVFVAGRIGKDIQAAYGFVIQIYFIFSIVANALTVGTVSIVSRLFCTNDRDELSTAVFSSLATAAVVGVLLAITGVLTAPVLIGLTNVPVQIKPFCVPLVQIYSGGLFFQYVLITCNGVLRSCNRIKDSLRTMTVVCLLNVGLNLLFVFCTPLGFKGIALATATSALIGGMINLRLVATKIMTGLRTFSRGVIGRIFKIGWPMGIVQILWQLGSMALFFILSELPANRIETIAAFTTGLRIESFIYMPAFAFNMANAVIVGNLLGEKKPEEAYRSGLTTALVGVSLVIALVIIVMTNAWWITSFFSNNPLVVQECVKYIYIALISEPFMAWGIILGGGLGGAGDTKSVMIRVAGSVWFVRLPLAYLFVVVLGYGAVSVWWCMNISQFVQCFLLYRRFSRRKWLEISSV